MPRIDLGLFRGSALSLASQGIGVLQLFALLWRTGATNATDAYFYLFNLGLLPTQILTVGVMYPMMLSDERLSRPAARRLMVALPPLAVVSVALGAGWMSLQGRMAAALVIVVALSAVNAAVQAALWQRAMAAAAGGEPAWEAGVALPANVLAVVVLLFPWPDSTATVTAMLVALVIGNAAFLWFAVTKRVGQQAFDRLPSEPSAKHGTHWWFLAKSGTGYGGLTVLQSLAVLLPASAVTFLSLAVKLTGSVAATFINAVMPRLIHQDSTSTEGGRRFLRQCTVFLAPLGVLGALAVGLVRPDLALGAVVIAMWLVASSSSATAQRLAFRFLPPSASRVSVLVVPLVVAAAAASAVAPGFDLVTLLCAYAACDALVGAVLLRALDDKRMTIVGGAISVALAVIWGLSLANS